jgi:molecular chaperone Hsp33
MDQIQRFVFDDVDARGEIIQINQTLTDVLASQDYPKSLQALLGEMLVATSLLVETLKIEGEVSLQVQGQGDVNYAVITANHQQQLRGIARWNNDPGDVSFEDMFKGGIFTITITPAHGQRYQGIVAIDKPTLAECIEAYFVQSEQLPTRIEIRLDLEAKKAAGLFLQVLPGQAESSANMNNPEFEHLSTLAETITADELTTLSFNEVLHRLFHENEVRLFDAKDVMFKCTCSKEKSANALKSIDKAELLNIVEEEGAIVMNCQYCHAEYRYDAMDVESIHSGFYSQAEASTGKTVQ